MSRAARWLTFGAAASIVFSIAAFNILMGLALAALLFSGEKLRLPRIKLPLAIFMALTILAWICSPDPWFDGYPQIRKFWVFCILLLVFSTLRSLATIRWLFLTWVGLASISALPESSTPRANHTCQCDATPVLNGNHQFRSRSLAMRHTASPTATVASRTMSRTSGSIHPLHQRCLGADGAVAASDSCSAPNAERSVSENSDPSPSTALNWLGEFLR